MSEHNQQDSPTWDTREGQMSDLEQRLLECGDCGSGCVGPMSEAANTLAAVREWAENERAQFGGDAYAWHSVLEILNRSDTDE